MAKKVVDTIIISDIHLGFSLSQTTKLLKTLSEYKSHRLILNGDIFDDLNFNRLRHEDWDVLSYFRKLSKRQDVIWIVGNHDGQASILSHLIGVKVHNQYSWNDGGLRCLAIHGHQFDRFITKNIFLSYAAGWLYYGLVHLDGRHPYFTDLVKKYSRSWLRLSNEVASGALMYGRLYRAEAVFCGHTHRPLTQVSGKMTYYNSGSWVETPATLITIKNGQIKSINIE
ncbi:UDP-2,3-diacylglucosamine diphosphatase [Candidatus Falkowbacteria bacterium CG10_big_fil_rev_8_21_14_0_10_37_14]|uniref:UDP-2,3-diacylglucosamine diphosphatase n=1 Tax=Candidatus Falkowbacteria bacterium CG10_big_fil_rev_8_21_14_0_10_37_14 TaxID=1974561 RepID=A0A2M6WSZ1_9BACT|nr:UDP-2,3-diacylglucosamine diphosphatase [Candidatus Falkowbacteria bacterium]PIT95885.1 MAG: UDP-2,3-diacylglucosamine diphosphatase [Candidatus Falkowbacteria bacterium CG10_big_fil_rev_8_21_14_0_10_37_14]